MRRASLLTFMVLVAWALVAPAQETATQQQPTITRHWSKNPYPTTFPENARVYIIVRGDTLWDISERFYRNPLLWPHVHAANPYISDPHWIYPEDPIVLPDLAVAEPGVVTPATGDGVDAEGDAAAAAAAAGQDAAERAAAAAAAEQAQMEGAPADFEGGVLFETEPRPSREYKAAARDLDLYCSSMVYPEKLPTALYIAGREEQHQIEIQQWDIIYLNQGRDLLKPGDLFLASNYVYPVREAETGRHVGHAYQEVGVVRVLIATEDHAVAEVVAACDGLRLGTVLTPFEQRPNPMVRIRETMPVDEQYFEYDRSRLGHIVYINYMAHESGEGDVVNIDLGSDQGLGVGDRIIVIRDTELANLHTPGTTPKVFSELDDNAEKPKKKMIGRAFGEGVVLRTTATTAAVKLTYTVDFPQLGAKVIAVGKSEGTE